MEKLLYDATDFSREEHHGRTLLKLVKYLWFAKAPWIRLRVIAAVLCLLAAKSLFVYMPFFYKHVIDQLTLAGSTVIVFPVLLILSYGGARAASLIFGELRDLLFVRVEQTAIRDSALEAFSHLMHLPLAFHLERQTGGLARVIERAIKSIDFILRFMLFNIIPTLLEITLVCLILYAHYPVSLMLTTISSVVVYVIFTIMVTQWRLIYRKQMNNMDAKANTQAVDALLNFETVKYFCNEQHEQQRYQSFMQQFADAAVRNQSSLSALNVGQAIIVSSGMIIVMLIAAKAVLAKTMTLGDFVLVNTYLMQLFQPLTFLGFLYRQIKESLVNMDKMFELLQVKSSIEDKPNAQALRLTQAPVMAFRGVDFAYQSNRQILADVSFTLEAGQKVAVVGPSGAGKSTLARLIYRFYDVTAGCITLNDQDIREVTQTDLRRAIGIVPQDTVLFNDTIGYNIAYGDPAADEAAIMRVADQAQIGEFIRSLPEGLATRVGERGLKLSGGEKQRVAIARMLLKNPYVMVFDEATSALDTHTEKAIQAALNRVSAGRTTLVVAHRLSTIIDADVIIVLQAGRIVEQGQHAQLLAADGEYAKMWRRQQQVACLLTELF